MLFKTISTLNCLLTKKKIIFFFFFFKFIFIKKFFLFFNFFKINFIFFIFQALSQACPKFKPQQEFGEPFQNSADYHIFQTYSVAVEFLVY
jgi:hypothetical protein